MYAATDQLLKFAGISTPGFNALIRWKMPSRLHKTSCRIAFPFDEKTFDSFYGHQNSFPQKEETTVPVPKNYKPLLNQARAAMKKYTSSPDTAYRQLMKQQGYARASPLVQAA